MQIYPQGLKSDAALLSIKRFRLFARRELWASYTSSWVVPSHDSLTFRHFRILEVDSFNSLAGMSSKGGHSPQDGFSFKYLLPLFTPNSRVN
jgi:hypothetical protein